MGRVAKPVLWNMTGCFKPFFKPITYVKDPKTGRIKKLIELGKGNTQQRIQNFFKKYGDYILIEMSMEFAETAAKYTPPQIGKAYIDPKYYYRPVQDLVLLTKGAYPPYHATKADYAALREGYKFRVLNTKVGHKKNEVYAYTRGINEAKRVSRIQNRGLSRYSWGNAINNVKQDIENQQKAEGELAWNWNVYRAKTLPPIFKRLASQSPNIKKYQWGYYEWHNDKKSTNKIIWIVKNRLADIQRYGELAVRQGLRKVKKIAQATFRGIANVAQTPGSWRTGRAYDPRAVALTDLRAQLVHMFDSVVDKWGIERLEWEINNNNGKPVNVNAQGVPTYVPQNLKTNITINL